MLLLDKPRPDLIAKSVGFMVFFMFYTLGQIVWAVILVKSWDWGSLPYDPNVRHQAPAEPPIVIIKKSANEGSFIKLPAPMHVQRMFASEVASGVRLRHRNFDGRVFRQSGDFSLFLDALVANGLATRNSRGVVDLNQAGIEYFEGLRQ